MPAAPRVTTASALLRLRLRNTRLVNAPFRSAEQAVAWFGAVQAQDYAGAKWALGQRLRKVGESELDRSLDSGTILRTHVLRPTWHFVLPADIRWLLKLTAPRILALMAYYDRALELDEATFRRSNAALAKALQGGKCLTRSELAEALQRVKIAASGQRLGHLVMRAEVDAVLCSGPRRGKQFTYALLDERAAKAPARTRDEALAELTRRYVKSHGPCLARDFAWWSGLSVSDAKRGLASIASELDSSVVGSKTYWFHGDQPPLRRVGPTAHLLPNYDEFLVAYKDHALVLDGAPTRKLGAREIVLGGHILVIDGQIAGGWRRTLSKDAVRVEVTLLASLTSSQEEALALAAQRYAEYLGLSLDLRPPKRHRRSGR